MIYAGYDVIGDIHGYAAVLESLLAKLGYSRSDGTWVHSERRAVFVGDFVDRGPENLRTCRIVMDMMAEGSALAVMGNHDFNAICLSTPDPEQPGAFLRPHTEKNLCQTATTRIEMQERPDESIAVLAWMRTLPLWLELDGLRVVHAAWSAKARLSLEPWLEPTGALTDEGFIRASRPGDVVRRAREIVLNGFETQLPDGLNYVDEDGHERQGVRLSWWRANRSSDLTWREAALVPDSIRDRLPELPLPGGIWAHDESDEKITVFGHYWMASPLAPLSAKHVCVDASIAKGGHLAAYRFSGEQTTNSTHLMEISFR